ncbi:MAG: ATP-dependent DNA ligase [Verrucomicrobiales bacterium]|nr:ATP-dependent DNA ligase [Verrucomicrobiales bacterium]
MILCSTATRQLLEARFQSAKGNFVALDWGETRIIDDAFEIELLPAGHIAGSAMLFLKRLSDGATLIHTGDFKIRDAPGAEANIPRKADTLIMETTFGIPKFDLPPSGEVLEAMAKFAREAIEDDEIPVFMAYALGKAQEIMLSLPKLAPELKFQVHGSVARMNEVMTLLGYQLPGAETFAPKDRSPLGHVLIMPPSAARGQVIRRMKKQIRLAMVSGWGMDSGAKYRYQCDEVFPLSDHAGYSDLLTFVASVDPDEVFTIHGYTDEFARDLRSRGIEAWPLIGETQLDLGLSDNADERKRPDEGAGRVKPRPASEFGDLTEATEAIAAATGKLEKQRILSDYLRRLDSESLALAVTFLSGRSLPQDSEVRASHIGWATIRQALLDLTGLKLAEYRRISSAQADASRTAYLILQGKTDPEPHSLAEVAASFRDLARADGMGLKIKSLGEMIATFHHSEAALLVGILTGELRIGLKEGLIEESIAAAFDLPGKAIRDTHMLTGDIGKTAVLAHEDRLGEAELSWFVPIKVMLASPEDTAEEIAARLGPGPIWLEDKFDGIRAQLHRKEGRVEIYSRDLRPVHGEFPEIVTAGAKLDRDCILDGEIIAYSEARKLTFFDLQKRLGRRAAIAEQGDLFLGDPIPVKFVAFDLLALDREGWLERPLRERREMLESLTMNETVTRCELTFVEGGEAIDDAFNEARRRDNEGLIAKDPESLYSPGRRGKQWLKLKKAMPTLDVVVVKAQQGHGKRSHVLSDYTFAVKGETEGELRVIGKAYSGLTDLEIEELTAVFEDLTLEKKRNVRTVEPKVVLEIAFDSINPSKRHDSGLALRFPRIKAIRRDKTPDTIDTLAYARKLAGLSG